MRRALAALFMLTLAGCATNYVPDSGWEHRLAAWRPDDAAQFYERWYGGQLAAMREPSFQDANAVAGFARRYRLTVLPTFTPGFAARVDQRADGRAVLHWVILDGAGGYDPGTIADRGAVALTPEQVESLDRAIAAANLPVMVRAEPVDSPRIDPETGATVMTICVDGTTWLFELASPDRQAFLTRSCVPDEVALRGLIDVTYALLPTDSFDDVAD
ncbi:MAG: hypothetical protein J7483_11275 [Novosphingobium sp.]|nr:hypothetical protein [Novosphingobium sp.]